MKAFTASLLALGLAATTGAALAQSYRTNDPYRAGTYRTGDAQGAIYDYARVLRVDPVFDNGYARNDPRCRSERVPVQGGGYYGDDYTRGDDRYYQRDGYGQDVYGRDGYGDDGYRGGSQTGRTVATVVGGLVGAVVGSKVGGGSARYATSALGSMVGGMAGRQIYDQSVRRRQPQDGMVTVCDHVSSDRYYNGDGRAYRTGDSSVQAYDVTYEYAGRQFTTRTNYHPGDRIRVRVDVRPE